MMTSGTTTALACCGLRPECNPAGPQRQATPAPRLLASRANCVAQPGSRAAALRCKPGGCKVPLTPGVYWLARQHALLGCLARLAWAAAVWRHALHPTLFHPAQASTDRQSRPTALPASCAHVAQSGSRRSKAISACCLQNAVNSHFRHAGRLLSKQTHPKTSKLGGACGRVQGHKDRQCSPPALPASRAYYAQPGSRPGNHPSLPTRDCHQQPSWHAGLWKSQGLRCLCGAVNTGHLVGQHTGDVCPLSCQQAGHGSCMQHRLVAWSRPSSLPS